MNTLGIGMNFMELEGRVYFEPCTVSDLGRTQVRLIVINQAWRVDCRVDDVFLASLPVFTDGAAVKVQVKRIKPACVHDWQVLGMVKSAEDKFSGLDLLPIWLCERQNVIDNYYEMDGIFNHPGLREFLWRAMANTDFAKAYVTAYRHTPMDQRPSGILQEAIWACEEIKRNPFLNDHQKELARVAALLHRPGRLWCGTPEPEIVGPPSLHLNRQAVGWMSKTYPEVFQKLVDIWQRIDNPSSKPKSNLPNDVYVAVWMALGLTAFDQPFEEYCPW